MHCSPTSEACCAACLPSKGISRQCSSRGVVEDGCKQFCNTACIATFVPTLRQPAKQCKNRHLLHALSRISAPWRTLDDGCCSSRTTCMLPVRDGQDRCGRSRGIYQPRRLLAPSASVGAATLTSSSSNHPNHGSPTREACCTALKGISSIYPMHCSPTSDACCAACLPSKGMSGSSRRLNSNSAATSPSAPPSTRCEDGNAPDSAACAASTCEGVT